MRTLTKIMKFYPQSTHYRTDSIDKERLMEVGVFWMRRKKPRTWVRLRFCMGAAWKYEERDMPHLTDMMIKGVKGMGLETCMTLGMLTPDQALAS